MMHSHEASKGGMLNGPSHAEGGIKGHVLSDSERPLEFEGGEVVITKKSVDSRKKHDFNGRKLTNKEILSEINQQGGGVPIYEKGGVVAFKNGGVVSHCTNCRTQRNAFFSTVSKIDRSRLQDYQRLSGFAASDIKTGDMLFLYCSNDKEYCVFDVLKIKDGKVSGKNLVSGFTKKIDFSDIPEMNPILFRSAENQYKEGGTVSRFSDVKHLDRSKIGVNPKMFQGREGEYSEKTVNKIVAEGFDKNQAPIIVWYSKKDKKYYVISGHSRWEASERLYKQGDETLKTMPVREFLGSRIEALKFAIVESNRSDDPESLISDVNAVAFALKNGYNKEELLNFFPPESYLAKLKDFSHLNPKGLFLEYLGSESETSFPYIESNARWVAQLRKAYPAKLTNAHENEIFKFFYKPGKGKPRYDTPKQTFFQIINKKVTSIDFDPNNSLQLVKEKITKTASVAQDQFERVKSTIDWLKTEFVNKLELMQQSENQKNDALVEKFKTEKEGIESTLKRNIKNKIILEKQIKEFEKQPQAPDLFSNISNDKSTESTEKSVKDIAQSIKKRMLADKENRFQPYLKN